MSVPITGKKIIAIKWMNTIIIIVKRQSEILLCVVRVDGNQQKRFNLTEEYNHKDIKPNSFDELRNKQWGNVLLIKS